jgi:ADP-heptose:LPS heptosyltransferase
MGIGGMLFWTVLAREVYNKHKKKVVFVGKKNQIIKDSIYINNPHISFEKTDNTININLNRYRNFHLEMMQEEHGIISRCNFYGYNPTNIYPVLNYTKEEEEKIKELLKIIPEKFICIEPHAKTSWTHNKSLPLEKWQNIVNELIKHGIIIIQVSIPKQKLLDNVIDFRSKLSNFRECACLLKYCSLFLSTEGGLMHASVANNNKCYILYPPMFHPKYTLYDRVSYTWIHSNEHNCCYKQTKCEECLNLMNGFDEFSIIKDILDLYLE